MTGIGDRPGADRLNGGHFLPVVRRSRARIPSSTPATSQPSMCRQSRRGPSAI